MVETIEKSKNEVAVADTRFRNTRLPKSMITMSYIKKLRKSSDGLLTTSIIQEIFKTTRSIASKLCVEICVHHGLDPERYYRYYLTGKGNVKHAFYIIPIDDLKTKEDGEGLFRKYPGIMEKTATQLQYNVNFSKFMVTVENMILDWDKDAIPRFEKEDRKMIELKDKVMKTMFNLGRKEFSSLLVLRDGVIGEQRLRELLMTEIEDIETISYPYMLMNGHPVMHYRIPNLKMVDIMSNKNVKMTAAERDCLGVIVNSYAREDTDVIKQETATRRKRKPSTKDETKEKATVEEAKTEPKEKEALITDEVIDTARKESDIISMQRTIDDMNSRISRLEGYTKSLETDLATANKRIFEISKSISIPIELITEDDAYAIECAVSEKLGSVGYKEINSRYKKTVEVIHRLCVEFEIDSLKELPSDKYDEALKFSIETIIKGN